MKIYSDPRLLALGVVGGTVSRHAGNMRERPVQDAFFEKLDIPSSRILRLHQVHGDHILPILTPEQAARQQKSPRSPMQTVGFCARKALGPPC